MEELSELSIKELNDMQILCNPSKVRPNLFPRGYPDGRHVSIFFFTSLWQFTKEVNEGGLVVYRGNRKVKKMNSRMLVQHE